MASIFLIPNGAGDETALSGVIGASEHWQGCINKDDGAHVYESGTTLRRDLYNLEEPILPTSPSIIKVVIRAYVKGTSPATGVAQTSIKTNGIVYDGAAENVITAYTIIETEYATNPQTGLAWTKAELQALQAGVVLKRPTSPQKETHCGLIQVIVFFSISTQTFFPITPTEITPGAEEEWVPMDASALIPEGATGVILHCINKDTLIAHAIGLRKNGSTDDRYTDLAKEGHCWAMIGVDGERIFEAEVKDATDIDIYVVGYTMSGVTFRTNAANKSLGDEGKWLDIDCNVEAPSAIGLIFEVICEAGGYGEIGFRKNGSSDDRHVDIAAHTCFGAVIGCDESQLCEGYREWNDLDFYLLGYITDGATFNLNATVLSLGEAGSYINLDALPDENPCMGIIEVTCGSKHYFGLRKEGESGGHADIYLDADLHPWAIVECDEARLIEGKIENLDTDFFLIGYAEGAALGWKGKISGVTDPAKIMGVEVVGILKVKGVE